MLAVGWARTKGKPPPHREREATTTVSHNRRDVRLIVTRCEAPCLGSPVKKRRGLGGYADAKVRLRGLCIRGRARGCKPCPNTMELCPK